MTQTQYIVGVDEVGRGPLAGPVAVCAAMVEKGFDFSIFPFLTDSKKLSEKRREVIFDHAMNLQSQGLLRFAVQFESAETIDAHGIQEAIQRALCSALANIEASHKSAHVFLDGNLKAPEQFEQETIIGGDGKVAIISLASVLAKVSRDRVMVDLCKEYPEYAFSKHKGYGTKAHIEAVKGYGPSVEHRKTFLTRIAPESPEV